MALAAPLDVALGRDTVLQPDLLVASQSDFTRTNLPVPPLLAVEILSPSTWRIDLEKKRERYQRAGVPSYWVIDPDSGAFTTWELNAEAYAEVASIGPGETWQAQQPFDITIAPADLIG